MNTELAGSGRLVGIRLTHGTGKQGLKSQNKAAVRTQFICSQLISR